jgi:hypothetical protein
MHIVMYYIFKNDVKVWTIFITFEGENINLIFIIILEFLNKFSKLIQCFLEIFILCKLNHYYNLHGLRSSFEFNLWMICDVAISNLKFKNDIKHIKIKFKNSKI